MTLTMRMLARARGRAIWFSVAVLVAVSFGGEALVHIGAPGEASTPATWPQFRHDGRRSSKALVPGPTEPTTIRIMPHAAEHYGNLIVGLAGQLLFSAFWYDGRTTARDLARLTAAGQVARLPGTRGCTGAPAQASDGTTYLTCPPGLIAYGTDGRERWRWASAQPLSGLTVGADGSVYVIRGGAAIVALTAAGTERWQHLPAEGRATALMVADSGAVHYIGNSDTFLRTLHSNGSVGWTFDTEFSITSLPVVDVDGSVYVHAHGSVYGVAPDGSLRWVWRNLEPRPTASMAVSDGVLYVRGYRSNQMYAIDAQTGVQRWGASVGIGSDFAISSEGIVYMTSELGVRAMAPAGFQLWQLQLDERWSGFGDLVLGPDRTLYAATESGIYIFR